MVVVEASGKPLVASNADLTSTRAGGLRTDLAAAFLGSLAEAAGLTIHVRLFEGEDSQHVLAAIFKALGVALAEACSPARRPAERKDASWPRRTSSAPTARPARSRARRTTRRSASATSSSSPGSSASSLETGELAGPAVEEQTEQIMRNLAAILEAAGSEPRQAREDDRLPRRPRRLRRHERGLRTPRRRPSARALDDRHLAAPERRARRDRSDRARVGGEACLALGLGRRGAE